MDDKDYYMEISRPDFETGIMLKVKVTPINPPSRKKPKSPLLKWMKRFLIVMATIVGFSVLLVTLSVPIGDESQFEKGTEQCVQRCLRDGTLEGDRSPVDVCMSSECPERMRIYLSKLDIRYCRRKCEDRVRGNHNDDAEKCLGQCVSYNYYSAV